jgi:hypothetical protein
MVSLVMVLGIPVPCRNERLWILPYEQLHLSELSRRHTIRFRLVLGRTGLRWREIELILRGFANFLFNDTTVLGNQLYKYRGVWDGELGLSAYLWQGG